MQTTRRLTATAALGVGIVLVAGAGVATATVGRSLLLGKTNTVRALTTLSNTAGTPLSLKAKAGKPPLQVNTKVEVPNLNAGLLGGKGASSFQRKIVTKEQCSQQPGSVVNGLASTGSFTCENQQAVQNGREPTGAGAPSLTVHDTGEYLLFANIELENSGSAAGDFVCKITWTDPSATGDTQADETYVDNVSPGAGNELAVAFGTSGANEIPSGTSVQAVCATASNNAAATIEDGDITAMPVAFQ